MSKVGFTPSPIRESYEALRSSGVEAELDRQGRRLANELKSVATATAHDKGDYANAFRVERHRDRTRLFVRVVNDDPAWVFVEYGGRRSAPRRIMRRVLDRMGR